MEGNLFFFFSSPSPPPRFYSGVFFTQLLVQCFGNSIWWLGHGWCLGSVPANPIPPCHLSAWGHVPSPFVPLWMMVIVSYFCSMVWEEAWLHPWGPGLRASLRPGPLGQIGVMLWGSGPQPQP